MEQSVDKLKKRRDVLSDRIRQLKQELLEEVNELISINKRINDSSEKLVD